MIKQIVIACAALLVLGGSREQQASISKMQNNGNYVLHANVYTDNDVTYIDDGTGSIQATGCNKKCNGYGVIHVKKQYMTFTANRFKPVKRVSTSLAIQDRKFSLLGNSVLTSEGWKNHVKNLSNNSTSVTKVDNNWIAQ